MKNVMAEITTWALDLPFWEQAALDKIIFNENFRENDYEQILQYLLEDEGLVEEKGVRPKLRFHQSFSGTLDEQKPVKINRIRQLQNVNALVSKQDLEFGTHLTIIYGANGSGKSGYARVLGSAGFTRGDRDVLPDITKPLQDMPILSAGIDITIDNQPKSIHYQIGRACPELASFYVFDSTSVHAHMCESNPLSFSPAGLSYLKRLASETDEVRNRLYRLIIEHQKPAEFIYLFQGETEISQLIKNLSPDTDLNHLLKLSHLTDDERRRKAEINIELGNIELDQLKIQIDELRQKIIDLSEFIDMLVSAQRLLNKEENIILKDVKRHKQLEELSKQISIESFQGAGFSHTGSDVWREFIQAARALAYSESTDGNIYPLSDSNCLLCHQPLSPTARELIKKLWKFLDGEYQSRLSESNNELSRWQQRLSDLRLFDLDEGLSTPYKYLEEADPSLYHQTQQLVHAYRQRKDMLQYSIQEKKEIDLSPLPRDCIPDIDQLLLKLSKQLRELESKDLEEVKGVLENEKIVLEHREILAKIFPQVRSYIEALIWARYASHIGGSTRHITEKHNALFNKLVTEKYKRLFEKTLKDLGRPLRIKVKTHGKKGDTLKQIILEADQSASNIAKPEKVLSEGEKRAVALADFLTEVALDTTSSGIILDDPVTSLDLEWRVTISKILVDEATKRQVIVFTHDLPFVYYLKDGAENKSIQVLTHWIKRGETDGRPGYVFLNNSPALEREYRKATRARDYYKLAIDADASKQEQYLRDGFAALRSSYEAFIVFDLFNEVVLRFNERISFGRLKDIVWDPSIADDVIRGCERLSRYIEGHLHSDEFMPVKPTNALLMEEIQKFESLQKKLKDIKSPNN
jgi:DNA repair exonuclease SbcCD ATPase subunit